MITKEEIDKVLKSAAEILRQNAPRCNEIAKSTVTYLVVKIKRQYDGYELLIYLCYRLKDSNDYIKSGVEARFFISILTEINTLYPKITDHLQLYTKPSRSLLDLFTKVPAPSLKERVKIANLSLADEFLDPITAYVMEYPVTYTINNVKYTIDLNTLLTADSYTYSLKCPFTRNNILLEELQPRHDLIDAVMEQCNNAPKPINEQAAIKQACILAQKNDVDGLKKWRVANPYINCSTIFKDTANKLCTPLHMACGADAHDAAIWLLEQGALPDIKNAAQKIPFEYLSLRSLKNKINNGNKTNGLMLLLALYNLYIEDNIPEYQCNVLDAVRAGYVPAMYWHGLFLCKHQHASIDNKNFGLELLCGTTKNDFYLVANSIISLLNMFLNGEDIRDSRCLGIDTSFKINSYFKVVMKMLASDAAFLNKGEIEALFAKRNWDAFNQLKCDDFQFLYAYGIAHLALTRESAESRIEVKANMESVFYLRADEIRKQLEQEKFLQDQQRAIDVAITKGDIRALHYLFDNGAQFSSQHVMLAIKCNFDTLDVLKWLVEHNVDINAKVIIYSSVETYCLLEAMKRHLSRTFELLLPYASTHTVLMVVARAIIYHGKEKFLDIILKNRSDICVNHISVICSEFDVRVREVFGFSRIPALMYASLVQNHNLLRVLLKHGAFVDIKNSYGRTTLFYLVSNNFGYVTPTIDILLDAGASVQNVLVDAVKNNDVALVTHLLNHNKCGIIDLQVLNDAIDAAQTIENSKSMIDILQKNRNKYYVYSIFKFKYVNRLRYGSENPTFVNRSIDFIVDTYNQLLETAGYIINCYNVAIVFHSLICLLAPKALLVIAAISPLLFYLSFCLFVKSVYNFRACVNAEAECFRFLLDVMSMAFNSTMSFLNSNVIKPVCNFIYNKMLMPIYEFFHGLMHKKITVDSDSAQTNETHTSRADATSNNYYCFSKCKSLLFGNFFSFGSSSEPPRQIEHTDDLEANLIRTRSYSRAGL